MEHKILYTLNYVYHKDNINTARFEFKIYNATNPFTFSGRSDFTNK